VTIALNSEAALEAIRPPAIARPILFSAPMVRAILAGQKTQTRRTIKWETYEPGYSLAFSGLEAGYYCTGVPTSGWVLRSRGGGGGCWNDRTKRIFCPQGMAGDRLWVREAWRGPGWCDDRPPRDIPVGTPIDYLADPPGGPKNVGKYRHARFMPRWMSRLTLEVTKVRVQRLHDISEEEAISEGVDAVSLRDMPRQGTLCRWDDFAQIWDLINGEGAWKANPWVFAISFRRCA
jgi:hypothetical protein